MPVERYAVSFVEHQHAPLTQEELQKAEVGYARMILNQLTMLPKTWAVLQASLYGPSKLVRIRTVDRIRPLSFLGRVQFLCVCVWHEVFAVL